MIRLYDFDEVRPEQILNRDIRAEADVEATVDAIIAVSYTHLRAHETDSYLVCRLLLEKKKTRMQTTA